MSTDNRSISGKYEEKNNKQKEYEMSLKNTFNKLACATKPGILAVVILAGILNAAPVKGQNNPQVTAKQNVSKTLIDSSTTIQLEARLWFGVKKGDLDYVKNLIKQGADVNAVDIDGWTMLMHAAWNAPLDFGEILVEHGADANAVDFVGRTALMYAAYNGHLDVVKYLVEKGKVDVNAKDNYGQTTLMYAAYNGHLDIVEYLLKHGADVNAQNNNGETALDLAIYRKNKAILFYLETTMHQVTQLPQKSNQGR